MPANERSALLNGFCNGNGNHIVYVSKDPVDYEPILCGDDFSSSLSLEELLPYKDDPWWQNVRRMMFFSFWITLFFTLFSACFLSFIQREGSCRGFAANSEALMGSTVASTLADFTETTS